MATPGNPLLTALMQRLAQAHPPGGGGPGGPGAGMPPGVQAAQSMGQTPFGNESQDLDELKSKVGTLIQRVLTRSSEAAKEFITAYRALEKGGELLAQLPAQPVGAPPPGLPMMGGPAMTPPMGDTGPPPFPG